MEYYYMDQLRWNFGFENPNHAAALIASLLPFVWAARSLVQPQGKFTAVLWWTFASGCLVVGWWLLATTLSRGGLVAAIGAFAFILWRTFPEWKRRWKGEAFVILGILMVVWSTGLAVRSTEGLLSSDASIENRFDVWRGGLQMLAIAPWGVGGGKSGEFYMHWLQPVDSTTGYRTLVNSYLTYLTEHGLILGFLALITFALIILSMLPAVKVGRSQRWVIASHASLIAFGIAGLFSTTFETLWTWSAPLLALGILGALTLRFGRTPIMPLSRLAITTAGMLAILLAVIWSVGFLISHRSPQRITLNGEQISIGAISSEGKPIWVALSDPSVAGPDFGKRLRQLASAQGIEIIAIPLGAPLPKSEGIVAMGDRVNEVAAAGRKVLLIAPSVTDEKQAQLVLDSATDLRLVSPGFDEDGRVAFWTQQLSQNTRKIQTLTFEGFGNDLSQQWVEVARFMNTSVLN